MEKAFAYIRVSDPSQINKDGFTRQEKAIQEYARGHDLQVVDLFKEEGVSGTKVPGIPMQPCFYTRLAIYDMFKNS